jgi:putative N6-adenine-specific DNA methylase
VRWLATCPEETKQVLLQELLALGVTNVEQLYRGIAFDADLYTGYKAHLWLRTASRIQKVVARFPLSQPPAIDWTQWLLPRVPFKVSPIPAESDVSWLASSIAAQGFTLDADSDSAANVIVYIRHGEVTLGLDSAGRALHKRGWRTQGHPAVLKETLAAALLLLAGYDGSEPLLDPMCGSGTIAIEGAYIALHKAPLIHRGKDDFAFEHQAGFDRALWRKAQDEARNAKLAQPPFPIFASDIREAFVKLAQQTALRARVEKHMQFSTGSFFSIDPPASSGLVIANLPYGERIHQTSLREVGNTLRGKFASWRAALLVPRGAPLGELRIQPRKVFDLMNGALEVQLVLIC